jgi:hypothetical protein
MPACHGFVIAEKSIEQLQEYMTSGNLTSVQLTSCYLQRVYQTRDYLKYVIMICKIRNETDQFTVPYSKSTLMSSKLLQPWTRSAVVARFVVLFMVFRSQSRTSKTTALPFDHLKTNHVAALPQRTRCRQLLDHGHCKDALYLVMPTW